MFFGVKKNASFTRLKPRSSGESWTMRLIRAVADIAGALLRRYRLTGYDDFTIAGYFREQGARVGENCRILIRDLGSEPYLIRIGNHCTIAGDVVFVTHDGAVWIFTEEMPGLQKFGVIEILDNCFIGHGVILMPNLRIGPNSVVGAGAVVTRHVPPNTVVAGNPAKPICTIDEYRRKALATWRLQKPVGYLADLHDGERYAPADIQKRKERSAELLQNHLQKLLWDSSARHADDTGQASPPSSAVVLTHNRRHSDPLHGRVTGRSRSSE